MIQQEQRLHRSREDRLLFGVAGGLAEYFDVDPVLVRLGWVLLILATVGIAALAYIVLAAIMPNSRSLTASARRASRSASLAACSARPRSKR